MRWAPVVAAVALALLFFGDVILGGQVYYPGDIARVYLPQRVALARSLAQASFAWWAPELGIGYPLLASEAGVLYPPNWLLYLILTPERAISASIVLHYALAGAGFYVYVRRLGRSAAAALLGSMVLALGGFYIARLSHIGILSVAAWLPWMFALTHSILQGQGRRRGWQAAALGAVVGLQFLAAHPQMALLGLIPMGLYAALLTWRQRERRWPRAGAWLAGMALGAVLGAPQLLPTFQLGLLSQRAGGLDTGFFTSYSFHPFLLATYLSPFVLGNPYPEGSVELMAYVGLLPLALAWATLERARRERQIADEVAFWAVLAVVGVVLAFGRYNPLYGVLARVPLLNLFRVPARYLYWTGYGLAVLATDGLDVLREHSSLQPARWGRWLAAGIGVVLLAVMVVITLAPDADAAVVVWRWLPLPLAAVTLALILGVRHLPARDWIILVLAAVCVDLYAYHAMLRHTYSASMPYRDVAAAPESRAFFDVDDDLYRLYTKDEILPALSVQRESYYPNMASTQGLSGANVYLPLVPRAYDEYLRELDPERLNRLNVRYYLIPQLLPVDEASELYDVQNPFSALPVRRWLEVEATRVVGVEVESYLSHAAGLADGTLAAELHLRDSTGQTEVLALRVGLETAEWAYARDDVREVVAHSMPDVATTFPARSGFPPREHAGHTYRARLDLPAGYDLAAVRLDPAMPEAFVRVERVRLLLADGRTLLLNHLIGLGDHTLAYRTEDVLIYRNEDVLPRAYTVPASRVLMEGGRLYLPDSLQADAVGDVTVTHYGETRVVLQTNVDEPAYLILADLYYPGWRATVDGHATPILPADGVFRAVHLPAGRHSIEFTFRPFPGLTSRCGFLLRRLPDAHYDRHDHSQPGTIARRLQ
jgi:hypothetical protein